ncbi:MAG: Spy/CpxP family protein refolding chaperone [Chthoniobacterales bacterium]
MKLTLVTLTALSALSLGHLALANDGDDSGPRHHGGRGHRMSLERTTEQLNLTPQQKTQVQPIIDQAKPQIETIRREATDKTKAVMDNAMAQIRPLLTPEQQKVLDDAKNERPRKHKGRGAGRGQGDDSNQSDQDSL